MGNISSVMKFDYYIKQLDYLHREEDLYTKIINRYKSEQKEKYGELNEELIYLPSVEWINRKKQTQIDIMIAESLLNAEYEWIVIQRSHNIYYLYWKELDEAIARGKPIIDKILENVKLYEPSSIKVS